jgi:hypothetical protein
MDTATFLTTLYVMIDDFDQRHQPPEVLDLAQRRA